VFTIPQWQDFSSKRKVERGNGRRSRIISANQQGRYVSSRFPGSSKVTDLAFDATVRAAAPFQSSRDRTGRAVAIGSGDLRIKIREKRTGGCILFVVDASASMGANRRMKEVKAAILSLLNVSYQKRDRVGLIAFRKESAELLLGFTRSVELAQKQLELLPTGGRTPLADGLSLAYEVIMGLKMRDAHTIPTIVLVSDGRASGLHGSNAFAEAIKAAERIGNQSINTIVIDTENDFIRFRQCEKLNEKLHGILVNMEDLRSTGIVQVVDALKGNAER
jgi:magnesium chelatase subunit D